jgi:hypothetical protein
MKILGFFLSKKILLIYLIFFYWHIISYFKNFSKFITITKIKLFYKNKYNKI